MPSALEMSRSVFAVLASLTRTPPKPRKDPSTGATATFWLISWSQGFEGCCLVRPRHRRWRKPPEVSLNELYRFRGLRLGKAFGALQECFDCWYFSKSATAALMSSLELGSRLTAALAGVPARLKSTPQAALRESWQCRQLCTLSNTLVHSSGVKSFFDQPWPFPMRGGSCRCVLINQPNADLHAPITASASEAAKPNAKQRTTILARRASHRRLPQVKYFCFIQNQR